MVLVGVSPAGGLLLGEPACWWSVAAGLIKEIIMPTSVPVSCSKKITWRVVKVPSNVLLVFILLIFLPLRLLARSSRGPEAGLAEQWCE